jgi:hypothetical protein
MKKLLIFLLMVQFGWLWSQSTPLRCDSSYVEMFSKDDFDDQRIPCDTFVVMGRGYYERIAIGYNLRGDIVAGQGKVIDNLALQLQFAKERTDTLQKIVALTEATLSQYRALTTDYEKNLANSLALNKTVVDSTRIMLTELRTQHVKEVKRAKWGGIALGGALGALIGFVAALLFFK